MLSIIVPCYNEEESLPIFYNKLIDVLTTIKEDTELIFIDDGSKDSTIKIITSLAEQDKRVKYLSFSRNFGKEAAMYAGLNAVSGDYAVIMDADLQNPPDLLPEMLDDIKSGECDSVATRRVTRKGEPPIRSLFARMFYKIKSRLAHST